MKGFSISRLPDGIFRKISGQFATPTCLGRDEGDLIGIREGIIARKTTFWTCQVLQVAPAYQTVKGNTDSPSLYAP